MPSGSRARSLANLRVDSDSAMFIEDDDLAVEEVASAIQTRCLGRKQSTACWLPELRPDVAADAGVQPNTAIFRVADDEAAGIGGPAVNVVNFVLKRAFGMVQLKLRSDLANSGHWAAALPPNLGQQLCHGDTTHGCVTVTPLHCVNVSSLFWG